MTIRTSCTILLTSLACAVVGHAQTSTTSGALKGVVRAKNGSAVATATLLLRNVDTGLTRKTATDAKGEYQFAFLPVGTYELTVTSPGLKTAKDAAVHVGLGQTASQNFSMDVAEAAAVVEVVSSSTGIDSAQINTQTSISQEMIEAIPVNGRNFTDLVQLTPGAAVGGTSYYTSVEGARGIQNNLQIDGASFNSKFNSEQRGGTRIPFSFGQDSIKELQVITNSFDAQYGDAVGAVINAVTKTGTNDPNGMAFILFRPNSLVAMVKPVPYDPKGTANDPAVRTRNFTSTQVGFNYGGPIIKDRLHYFINVEANRRKEDSVPAFGYNNTTGNYAKDYNDFFGPTGMGNLMVTMPGKTLAQENGSAWTDQQTNLVVMGRLDWTINTNHRATLRLNSQSYEGLNGIYAGSRRSDTAESGNSTMKFSSLSTVMELNSILTPTLVNEARLQLSNEKRPTTPNSTISSPVRIANSGSGYYINAGQYYIDPRTTDESTTQFQDNLTYMTGDWMFKGGVDLQWINMKNRYLPSAMGNWTFTTYDAANKWFAGTPNSGSGVSYTQGYSPLDGVSDFDEKYFAGYLQTQYTGLLDRRLILNLGVRFSGEAWSGNPNPNPKLQGLDRAPNDTAVDPRFGFSFDIFGNSKTVLRGGYGWFSISNPGQTASGAIMNNGLNLLSYYVSSSSNSAIFGTGGILSADSRWSGATDGPGSLTPVPTASLATALPKDSISITIIDPNAKMSQARATSLGVEHDFGEGYSVGVRGTYKQFLHLQYAVNINLAQYVDGSTTALSPIAYNDGYATKWNHFSNNVDRRPYRATVRGRSLDLSGFGDVMLAKYDGEGRYKSLVFEFNKRPTDNGWGFRGSWTFAKAEDNNSNERATLTSASASTENPADPLQSYALSDNDHEFRAVMAWYAPTFYGIRVSGITTFTSGRPFNAVYYDDQNGDGKFIDTVAGRNTYRQPDEKTFDLRISRTFQATKQLSLEATIDVFNALNLANQYTSQTTYGSGPGNRGNYAYSFGQIDRPDNRTREVQFMLKARF